ncbi:MAG: hypothetical protein AAF721_39810 [Myxococcota bacterium]
MGRGAGIGLGCSLALSLSACTVDGGSIGDASDGSGDGGQTGNDSSTGDDVGQSTGDGSTGASGVTGSETAADDSGTVTNDDDASFFCEADDVPEIFIDAVDIQSNQLRKVAVGGSVDMVFGLPESGGLIFEETEACIEWTVEPGDQATIDAMTGELQVNADAVPGTDLTITADLEQGRKIMMHTVEVYEPIDAPFLGTHTEVSRLACGTLDAVPAEPSPIGEVRFFDTGDFWVTWTPFETYVDYWGTFTYDDGTQALSMTMEGGNYEPADADLEGMVQVPLDADGIELIDMWLGSPQGGPITPQCGHVLE